MRDGDERAVVVVVPTRNSARTVERCLASLRAQTTSCRVVVVDNFSTDGTDAIAERIADRVVQAGPERSRQRNIGSAESTNAIVGFVDSDMVLAPSVVAEVVEAVAAGAAAVTVPERTVGEGFWAKVRAEERSYYHDQPDIEAPRFFRREVFESAGGFDEELTGAEDWDLAIRTRSYGPVGRTVAGIEHDEGRPSYLGCCRKKASYAEGIRRFARKHGMAALRRSGDRPYLRRPWVLLWPHPLLGCGVAAQKCGEAVAVALSLVAPAKNGRRRPVPASAR